ncbi:MAG: hypothetical protein QOH32_2811 [Bradyrhizobium sp.]|jgi:hypothetical protein|nr:hypothetical protein [Bradyrhizobium sp.]
MTETPADAVPQILIRIQDSIGPLRAELGEFKRDNEAQHERMEGLIRKHRHEAAATLVMMRATVSHFDQRVGALEERVTVLETPKS